MSLDRILVTGGAGFIGSHVVERLVSEGRRPLILDSLEFPTHQGLPVVPSGVPLLRGDVRREVDLDRAMHGVDAVIHLAATGGFRPGISHYLEVNTLGSARVLEAAKRHRVKKVVVASSVGVYGEGAYRCRTHGLVHPGLRRQEDLEKSRWEVPCPACGEDLEPIATPETTPTEPSHPYSISKLAAESLVIGSDLPAVALRFFLTYGPRQSLTNPYTGVVALFSGRLMNRERPPVFEDGRQTRDLIYVGDVARAVTLALDEIESGVFNVGSEDPIAIGDLARRLAALLGTDREPDVRGEFRVGEVRHLVADTTRLRARGWAPQVSIDEGLARTLEWISSRERVDDTLGLELPELRRKGVVRRAIGTQETPDPSLDCEGLSVIVPAYDEAGNLETVARRLRHELAGFVPRFEIIIVNDGSRDGTGTIADSLAADDHCVRVVHHPFNIGFGAAQKSGFRAASLCWVAVVPADHQFDAADLRRLWERRVEADLVGSRRIDRQDPLARRLISTCFNRAMRLVYGIPLRDINWVKMWRRSLFDVIDVESPGFGVDAEIVAKARALGFRIVEVDVPHHARTWGTPTGIALGTLTRTAPELLGIRRMLRETTDEAPAPAPSGSADVDRSTRRDPGGS